MTKSPSFDPREVFAKAIGLHQTGQFHEAEKLYKKIIDVLPDLEPVQSTLGAALAAQNKSGEALKVLQKALKLNPRSPDALSNIGAVYLQLGDKIKAEAAYRELLDLFPSNAAAHYNLGNVLREVGKMKEAIESYKRAIELDPGMKQAKQNLAGIYHMLGNQDEAMQVYVSMATEQKENEDTKCNLAFLQLDKGNYPEAVRLFNENIQRFPAHARSFAGLGKALWEQGLWQESLGSLEQALQLNPKDADSYILQGNSLNELRRIKEAIVSFKKALELNPESKEAKRNLHHCYMMQIPSWHFTMLADAKRNDAFQKAIEKTVTTDSRVLDIGTGSGLLAMMAARAGAHTVTACEVAGPLAEVATEIVEANGFSKTIQVVNKKSTNLLIPADLKQKVNVVVSEILDAGLLGEGVIPSVRHALSELAEPNAKVIPQAAKVYASLLEIPGRRSVAPVKTISGFDLSAFNRFRIDTEYTTIILAGEKHRLLSEARPVYEIDFRKLPPPIHDSTPVSKSISIKANANGTVHAVALWFDLNLDDEICVSSKPDGDMVHWGQAVCFLQRDVEVKAGEELKFMMDQSDSLIWFRLAD